MVIFWVESLELHQDQDVVGLNHPLESKPDLRLVTDHVIKNRYKRRIERLKLMDDIAVTGKVEEFKSQMFSDMLVNCLQL